MRWTFLLLLLVFCVSLTLRKNILSWVLTGLHIFWDAETGLWEPSLADGGLWRHSEAHHPADPWQWRRRARVPLLLSFRHDAPSALSFDSKTIAFIGLDDYKNKTCALFKKKNPEYIKIYVEGKAKITGNRTTRRQSWLSFWFIPSLFSLKAFMLFPQNQDILPIRSIL